VKKLTALLALVTGLVLTAGQDVSAGDFLFFHFEDDYSYARQPAYAPSPQSVRYQQTVQQPVRFFQPVRETAGNVAELYMDLSPGAQIAESIGLLDRGFVLGLFRSN
jgi:hypothetical protein